jgi:pimeloyl-ACP methyl ester carboxylesterase
MSKKPILLYLHGVGEEQDDSWSAKLDAALVSAGYPGLSGVEVVAPKYPHALNGIDDHGPLPKVTLKPLRGDAAIRNRRAFERRRTAMEVVVGPDDLGSGIPGADQVVPKLAGAKWFQQADNYVKRPETRAWVLRWIIERLPSSGRIVIVGHSLGSVIAADLLRRLPPAIEVAGMVTIGSPLASEALRVKGLDDQLAEPPSNLEWWVNFWSKSDPVTTHRGLATAFPWILDHRIEGGIAVHPKKGHSAGNYLGNETVAKTIGRGLFGSTSTDIVLAERGVDIALDFTEAFALLALRYAHLTMASLEDDHRQRFADALRLVQAETVENFRVRNRRLDRPLPSAIASLSVDLANPASEAPEPTVPVHQSIEEALVPLAAIAGANVLQPFEISVSNEVRRAAMSQLTLEMQLGSRLGTNVFEAIGRAQKALKGSTNWVKWSVVGLGAAAIVAAPIGLAVAAGAGLVGAAAITSALAAFGPGGMVGGLLTAGTLMTAGGGTIAAGLAAPGTTAEAAEVVVAGQLSVAILRDLQGLDQDPQTWFTLIEYDDEVSRRLARLAALSDKSSPTVKDLRQKLDAVNRALDYLHENDLGPTQSTDEPS